jgi:hypothetical protein
MKEVPMRTVPSDSFKKCHGEPSLLVHFDPVKKAGDREMLPASCRIR